MIKQLPPLLLVVSFGHALWQPTWPAFAIFAVSALVAVVHAASAEAHADALGAIRQDLETVRLKAVGAGESCEALRPKVEALSGRAEGMSALDKRLRHIEESVDALKNAQRPAEKPRL